MPPVPGAHSGHVEPECDGIRHATRIGIFAPMTQLVPSDGDLKDFVGVFAPPKMTVVGADRRWRHRG